MANDGQIVFEVTADGKHAIANIKDITRAIEQESKKWDDAAKESTDNIGNSFGSMLKKVAAGLSAAKIGKELLDMGKEAISLASDLEEVQNVVDVTFGPAGAAKIESWAKTAGTQFGLTETQAKKFTSTLGAMMKSAGMTGDEIVDMSTDLAGLSADMSSFYNLDFDEAFAKIRSGISGETEPLKQLGINMSVANLNAFALEQGLGKTFDQLSHGEQVMLRYKYLMQATADAQGDFARTSNGYANGLRKLNTGLDTLKTKLGGVLLDFVNPVVESINSLFPKEEERFSLLDQIAEVNINKEAKIAEINAVADEANALIDLLGEIARETTVSTTVTVSVNEVVNYLAMGTENDEAVRHLEALGLATDEINAKQAEWLRTCQELVKTIPGLSGMIDTNTGEVQGGIPALTAYTEAWERLQKVQAELEALQKIEGIYSAENNVDAKKAEMVVKRSQAIVRAKNALGDYLKDFLNTYNVTFEDIARVAEKTLEGTATDVEQTMYALFLDMATVLQMTNFDNNADLSGLNSWKEFTSAANIYYTTVRELPEVQAEIKKAEEELEEEYGKTREELEKETESMKTAEKEMTNLEKAASGDADAMEEVKTAVNNASEALKALADHYETVRKSVQSSVDSTIKGFGNVGKAADELRDKLQTNSQELGSKEQLLTEYGGFSGIHDMSEAEWQKLPKEIQDAYNEAVKLRKEQDELNASINKYSPKGMIDGLQSQIDYIDEYLANLEKAKQLGLSDELLAQLSDGSQESAEYLAQLANADEGTISELNDKYAELQKKKEGFADTLTSQQLTVDEVYNALLEDAKKAIEGLDLSGEAAENSGKTVEGVAQGIADHVPDVKDAVDSVLAQLARLSLFGIIFPTVGVPTWGDTSPEGSFASGIDYVPNHMFAYLHEGEAVLTAEENKIRHGYGNTQAFDYDAMGGVMRDNIKPGGNVYLDGRIVGSVISDQQGKSYRQLQRSGWQQ